MLCFSHSLPQPQERACSLLQACLPCIGRRTLSLVKTMYPQKVLARAYLSTSTPGWLCNSALLHCSSQVREMETKQLLFEMLPSPQSVRSSGFCEMIGSFFLSLSYCWVAHLPTSRWKLKESRRISPSRHVQGCTTPSPTSTPSPDLHSDLIRQEGSHRRWHKWGLRSHSSMWVWAVYWGITCRGAVKKANCQESER